ncbi:2-amino-4-hydroxy-6-hydroxymethyldihydropteridine diphosphokinase [Barrientosiimonas marina]|uniref:2-amino-4-hydroxy-6-hydroxymethyldihydropteridine diphosphokinase n=1 Tax=Lentibacillus kimchii TaxID=1542911 RepID=A0ABW2UWB2_9BACI
MNNSYIALGSNIEPRETYLQQAVSTLNNCPSLTVVKQSSVYETVPVGYTKQADFLNMVIEVASSLSALELLDLCQTIEQELGRKRTVRFGPRTVDLDILMHNQENRETERLTLPHPRMLERAFVLVPLCEIAPDLMVPATGKTILDYRHELSGSETDGVVFWPGSNPADD